MSKNNPGIRLIKNLFLIACIPGIFNSTFANNFQAVDANVVTPPLNLRDLTGTEHHLEKYKGKIVLVQFWATYCTPCRKEMPSMNNLMKKMGTTPFTILAINMGETDAEVKQFVSEVKPAFTILMDVDGHAIADWKVFAAPSNFIVGPDGKVRYTLFGGVEWDADEMVVKLKQLAK